MFTIADSELLDEGTSELKQLTPSFAVKVDPTFLNSYTIGGGLVQINPPIDTTRLTEATFSATLTGEPSGNLSYINNNNAIASIGIAGMALKHSGTTITTEAEQQHNTFYQFELSSPHAFPKAPINKYNKAKQKTERELLEEKAGKAGKLVNYNTVPPSLITVPLTGDELSFPSGTIGPNMSLRTPLITPSLPAYTWTPPEGTSDETELGDQFIPQQVQTIVEYENCTSDADLQLAPVVDSRQQSLCFDQGGITKKKRIKKIFNEQEIEITEITYGFAFLSKDVYTAYRGSELNLGEKDPNSDYNFVPSNSVSDYWQEVENVTTKRIFGGTTGLNTVGTQATFMQGYLTKEITYGKKLFRYKPEADDFESARLMATNDFCGNADSPPDFCYYKNYTNSNLDASENVLVTDLIPNVIGAMEFKQDFPVYREINYELATIPNASDGAKYCKKQTTTEYTMQTIANPSNQTYLKQPDLVVGKNFRETIVTSITGRNKYTVTTYTFNQEGAGLLNTSNQSSSQEFIGVPSEHSPSIGSLGISVGSPTQPEDCNLEDTLPSASEKLPNKEYLIKPSSEYYVEGNESSIDNTVCKTLDEAKNWARAEWTKTLLDSGQTLTITVPAPGVPVGTFAYGGVVVSNSITYSADDAFGGRSELTIVSLPDVSLSVTTRDIDDTEQNQCQTESTLAVQQSSISDFYPVESGDSVNVF